MLVRFGLAIALTVMMYACGSDADDYGVGAECTTNDQCSQDPVMQTCLMFKGGYCGIVGCTKDADCPDLSKCVAHTDGKNYCFRTCIDKPECNANRTVDNESNCSSNVTFVEAASGIKACVPPSS
jgi:hypothetical protein